MISPPPTPIRACAPAGDRRDELAETSAPAATLPRALERAFSGEQPGPARPPGPRVNRWPGALPVPVPPRLRALLRGLWMGNGVHLGAGGAATTIPRRPVPSAGAAYPVQTHLIAGAGAELPAGRYVFDHDRGILWRRDLRRENLAHGNTPPAGITLLWSVLPGRSFARYGHRAWVLWIADVAYTIAAAAHLLGDIPRHIEHGPGARLRELAALPAATETARWDAAGLIAEIPLAALTLPPQASVVPVRAARLAQRRSPAIESFEAAARGGADTVIAAEFLPGDTGCSATRTVLARASGQSWIAGADRVLSWSVPVGASPQHLIAALWAIHHDAARACYRASATGRWGVRPVSGFVGTPALVLPECPGQPHRLVHALAFLREGRS